MWLAELLVGLIQGIAEHALGATAELAIHGVVEKSCEPEPQFERVLAGASRSLDLNDR